MNRIRKINNIYQVLHTPDTYLTPSMEMLIGKWDDDNFIGFHVKEYTNLYEAQCDAYQHADIQWYKLVSMHVDSYHKIRKIIKDYLDVGGYIYEYDTRLATPEELKDITFDRIIRNQRFTLTHNMNDIINISISNPWTQNVKMMANYLKNIKELRIKYIKIYDNKVYHLIGKTDLGTIYEIKLWPTLIYNWAKWQIKNNNDDIIKDSYKKIILSQNDLDNGIIIT